MTAHIEVWVSEHGCFLANIPDTPHAEVDEILEQETPIFSELSGKFNSTSEWWKTSRVEIGSEARVTSRCPAWSHHGETGVITEKTEDQHGIRTFFIHLTNGWDAWVEEEHLRLIEQNSPLYQEKLNYFESTRRACVPPLLTVG